jgi:hypothetical protein
MLLETSGPTPSMLRGTDTKQRSEHSLALASRYFLSRTRAGTCACRGKGGRQRVAMPRPHRPTGQEDASSRSEPVVRMCR